MARVVVVGGGYGGLAAAVRLAKLGHAVTLLDRGPELGGAMREVAAHGFAWQAGPTYTLLPAVVRDLFRKSGRPLERELDLVELPFVREHWFEDGSEVRLPHGRGPQSAALEALAPGLGERWTAYVDGLDADWEVLRQGYLENPWRRDVPAREVPRELSSRLDGRKPMRRRLQRAFKDERLRLVAAHPFTVDGHDLRDVPAWAGITTYLEQRFGAWTVPGGMSRLTTALVDRLATREVSVLLDTDASDLVVRDGRAVGVRTPQGTVDADVVVCAVDPRRLPTLAGHVRRTLPAIPATTVHLGLDGALPESLVGTHEVVVHGDPLLVIRPGGRGPEGTSALTVLARGRIGNDILLELTRAGLDLRDQLARRLDRSPADLVRDWGGSPLGVLWQGRGTVRERLGPTTPVAGVYAVGASATPGSGLPWVGLGAAQVATLVGPA